MKNNSIRTFEGLNGVSTEQIDSFVSRMRNETLKKLRAYFKGELDEIQHAESREEGKLLYVEGGRIQRVGGQFVYDSKEEIHIDGRQLFALSSFGYIRTPFGTDDKDELRVLYNIWKLGREGRALQGLPWNLEESTVFSERNDVTSTLVEGDWRYNFSFEGDATLFRGTETVTNFCYSYRDAQLQILKLALVGGIPLLR